MKKLMLGALSLVCMFAIAGAGSAPPATAAPAPPAIGGCRWFCPGISTGFTTAAACNNACTSECDLIC